MRLLLPAHDDVVVPASMSNPDHLRITTCPLCGASAKRHTVLPHTQVWRCASAGCRLQFADPQLDEASLGRAYEQLYYPRDAAGELEPTSADVLRQFFESLRKRDHHLAGKRILDYGCGRAVLASVAREYEMLPTGIEADANAREQVRSAGICTVYRDIDELLPACPDVQFDYVVLWNVIEHLRRPWVDLGRLRPLCAPAAHLIVTTPNANCLRARVLGSRWDQRRNFTHFYYFTRTSLAATLRAAGFTQIVSHDEFTAYPHHGPLRRLSQRLLVACHCDGKLEFSAAPASQNRGRQQVSAPAL